MCLKGNGQLDGNASLDDTTSKCNEILMRIPNTYAFWLGILRQVFKTIDKGYPTELNSLKQCEFFNRQKNMTEQTNTCRKEMFVVCLVSNNASTFVVQMEDQPAVEESGSDNDIGSVVGGVFGGLFLIAIFLLLTVIIVRRRKKGRQEDQNNLKFESETPTSISELKVNQTNDNGFSRYPEMNCTDTKEDTYYKSQDDYDILGKRRSKLKGTQSENIYNHAGSTTNQNHYASAAQVSKRISGEDLYDHTNKSEYGTVSEIENDNMYSES
ncbi:uncharacterized protein LOC134265108 [Saccostrea cucullata]|uniref:uncharacterized protein LOC134265108 n=1 Tax=Saccostrea cuccullata TaxID=36930 RepID=UPI002ED39747